MAMIESRPKPVERAFDTEKSSKNHPTDTVMVFSNS